MNAEREIFKNSPRNTSAQRANDAAIQRQDNVDVLKTSWRWKWLILLGILLGITVGYLVIIQLPKQYESHALVQILTPSQKSEAQSEIDLGETALSETRQDEIRIMRGLRVVNNAIAIGKLDQHPTFAGKSLGDVIEWITDKDRLIIKPGTKELRTDLIDLTFECEDREFAGEVLSALLAGYNKYLTDAYSDRGTEVFQRLAEYRDQYDSRYRTIKDEYLKRVNSAGNIILDEDKLRNIHAMAFQEITKTITELTTEAGHYDAILNQVNEGMKAGRAPESLISIVEKELGSLNAGKMDSLLEKIEKEKFLGGATAEQIAKIKSEILEVEIEKEKLLGTYGEKHSTVKALNTHLSKLNEELQTLEKQDSETKQRFQEDLLKRYMVTQTPEERLSIAIGSLQEARQAIQTELQTLNMRAAEKHRLSMELQSQLAEVDILRKEMDLFEENATELKKTIQSLQVGADYNRKKMFIHDEPGVGAPSGPSYLKFLGAGGILGGLLFFGLAYLLEMADRSYRTPDEIMRSLNIQVLGHIPVFEVDRRELRSESVDASVVTLHKPQSNTSECYRGIRTSLFFANKKEAARVIQISSPLPGDGKSTLASNIAVSLAQSGRQVLLVDCDLRRPRGAKIFGVGDDVGLSSCILGEATISDAAKPTPVEGLQVMSSGPRVSNPSELLVSPEFEELLNEMRSQYEYVIIDTPPVLSVSDPASVAPLVDAVILTMRLRRNSRPIAEQAKHILDSVDAKIVGIVINGVDQRASYGYGGYRYDTSGVAGYSYGNRSYGYGGSGKVYGDEQMQRMAARGSGEQDR